MRRYVVLGPLVCLGVMAWAVWSVPGPEEASEVVRSAVGELTVGEPVRHGGLVVYPVLSAVPRGDDRFITLDEGLAAGTVEVFEVGADGERVISTANADPWLQGLVELEPAEANPTGEEQPVQLALTELDPSVVDQFSATQTASIGGAEVNRVMVVNRSGKPLYLMPGEIILGGQQDRSIAEEMILASTGEPAPVEVYCVEHGRWTGRAESETVALLLETTAARPSTAESGQVLEELAAETQQGKFVASIGIVSDGTRYQANSRADQQVIWDEVAKANASLGNDFETGAFTGNYHDADVRGQIDPYVASLTEPVSQRERIVGVVVAINGKVVAADVFESTPLFRKLWPKLLKSYALDAVAATDGPMPRRPSRVADARSFLHKAVAGQVEEQRAGDGGLVVTRRAERGVVSFAASPADAETSEGLGGAVHFSGFAR